MVIVAEFSESVKGSPDLLLTISFVGQLLTADSGSCMFQWLRDILSLLAPCF